MAAPKALANMNTRQKVTAVVFALVILILLWMIYGMFKPEGSAVPPPAAAVTPGAQPMTTTAAVPGGAPIPSSQPIQPKPAVLPQQPPPISPREAQLMQMQQETEMKYLAALNELQMLRIERDIAEMNKAIVSAKLDTVTAQKKVVDLLKPPVIATPATYAQGLISPTAATAPGTPGTPPPQPAITFVKPTVEQTNYTVISVSYLRSQWSAVIGFQGNLYQVHVGDVLPVDGSRVLAIDKAGLILEREGIRRRLSMVPII